MTPCPGPAVPCIVVEEERPTSGSTMHQRSLMRQVCADTKVGNHMIRGISGGQKKRVTTGEMIVGPAKTLFLDEISTGRVHVAMHLPSPIS